MITTKGFRDSIEMRRGIKPIDVSLYNLFIPPNRAADPALAPHRRRRAHAGRRQYHDAAQRAGSARRGDSKFKAQGVKSIAICFLHSYANPKHERRAAEICREIAPEIFVSTSHETLPVWREFERFNTTAVGSYVGPAVARYLTSLEKVLKDSGFTRHVPDDAGERPGAEHRRMHPPPGVPAAFGSGGGAVGRGLSRQASRRRESAVGRHGRHQLRRLHDRTKARSRPRPNIGKTTNASPSRWSTSPASARAAARWPRSMRSACCASARQSAGADPGPACYGRGDDATVTDANLILGYVPADYFLGGEMKLDEKASRRAMKPLMEKLGVDEKGVAEAIFRTVNANMANKITEVSTKRGYDIRDSVMIAGGGGGPIHAGFIADSARHQARWWCRRSRRSTAPSACSPWTSARTTRAPLSAAPATSISMRSTASTRRWKRRR